MLLEYCYPAYFGRKVEAGSVLTALQYVWLLPLWFDCPHKVMFIKLLKISTAFDSVVLYLSQMDSGCFPGEHCHSIRNLDHLANHSV